MRTNKLTLDKFSTFDLSIQTQTQFIGGGDKIIPTSIIPMHEFNTQAEMSGGNRIIPMHNNDTFLISASVSL
ncbi:hypothetical protein [Cardinium endosymbiont of Nabis limbatus]|uniref:hypothetical protein n=1 Tax=Cardinium endosymbiont of Nabis limbatus TaxID=3066217 RepID=UPI003AF3C227